VTERARQGAGLVAVIVMGLVGWLQSQPAGPDRVAASDQAPASGWVAISDQVAASEAALRAWAEFASTGDLSSVDGHFDPAGPQYRQLEVEASNPTWARGRYRFRLSDPVVAAPRLVTGTVTMEGPGGVIERYRWEIELRAGADGWRIWSVRTADE
jgi:hypothetical protein